jgi:hypothetical protein
MKLGLKTIMFVYPWGIQPVKGKVLILGSRDYQSNSMNSGNQDFGVILKV